MSKPRNYSYEIVTLNGAGVHARFDRLPDAREALPRIAGKWSFAGDLFEIQRVERTAMGNRRYTVRRRSRWVPWDCNRDAAQREPDLAVVSPGRCLSTGRDA